MELEERAEELLETLWIVTVEGKKDALALAEAGEGGDEAAAPLLKEGYVTATDGSLKLTEPGKLAARNVVRRHRLSERLLADVLGTGGRLMHEKACKFEHLIDRGLDESICVLLGHPKVCPHGKPIPPGRCCREAETQAKPVVSSLSRLAPGQRGKVAYIYAPEIGQLQKLMAMGILPGAPISLVQNFPSFVFRAGQSQFAVDKSIADAIYVRLIRAGAETPLEAGPHHGHGHGRGGGGRQRRLARWWQGRES